MESNRKEPPRKSEVTIIPPSKNGKCFWCTAGDNRVIIEGRILHAVMKDFYNPCTAGDDDERLGNSDSPGIERP